MMLNQTGYLCRVEGTPLQNTIQRNA